MSDKLSQLRNIIDQIDNNIVDLLNQRIQVIREVGEYKKSINENFFIKSAREADMIKKLLTKTDPAFPKSTIVNIWRKIITTANVLEQNLHIAIHNPDKIPDYQYLIKEYYGDFMPLSFFDSTSYIIADIEKGKSQIGVFAMPQENQNKTENWWINLANNKSSIKVFAKIPFVGKSQYDLVAVAIKEPEKSEDDNTLFVIETDSSFSKHQVEDALKKSGFKFKILKSDKLEQIHNINFHLVEIDGFFLENSDEVKNFLKSEIKPFVKILGHFAKTIK